MEIKNCENNTWIYVITTKIIVVNDIYKSIKQIYQQIYQRSNSLFYQFPRSIESTCPTCISIQ